MAEEAEEMSCEDCVNYWVRKRIGGETVVVCRLENKNPGGVLQCNQKVVKDKTIPKEIVVPAPKVETDITFKRKGFKR